MMGIVLLGISKWNNNSKHRYGKDTEKQGKFGEYLCGLCSLFPSPSLGFNLSSWLFKFYD